MQSVCVFHDPYERVNFWSHLLPGLAFVVLALAAKALHVEGTQALSIFCIAAATTHLLSALTHVFPGEPLCVHIFGSATLHMHQHAALLLWVKCIK